jgi:hypothetical protein
VINTIMRKLLVSIRAWPWSFSWFDMFGLLRRGQG